MRERERAVCCRRCGKATIILLALESPGSFVTPPPAHWQLGMQEWLGIGMEKEERQRQLHLGHEDVGFSQPDEKIMVQRPEWWVSCYFQEIICRLDTIGTTHWITSLAQKFFEHCNGLGKDWKSWIHGPRQSSDTVGARVTGNITKACAVTLCHNFTAQSGVSPNFFQILGVFGQILLCNSTKYEYICNNDV